MLHERLKEHRLMYRWARLVLDRAWLWLLLGITLLGISVYGMANYLAMNTDTGNLVAPDAPFQQHYKRLNQLFPQDTDTILVIVESDTPEVAGHAAKKLAKLLRADTAHFQSVYLPDEGAFFEQNGLLYLDLNDLEALSTQLAEAQPFLGRLAIDNSLHGLFGLLTQAVTAKSGDLPLELGPFLERIRTTMRDVREGRRVQLSWQKLMLEDGGKQNILTPNRRFIVARPVFDFRQFLPAGAAVDAVHAYAKQLQNPTLPEVRVRLTGGIMLEHEELAGVSQGAVTGAVFSLLLVIGVLAVAFRSAQMVVAAFLTLGFGMTYSGGFAAYGVGHLNLISIAFAVSNIGLGIEYAIHFCLRFRDYMEAHISKNRALLATLSTIAPSLLLAAGTTAIGLYAFIPTEYKGISELGLLAGTSLFLSLLATLTVLPAMLRYMRFRPRKTHHPAAFARISELLGALPLRFATHVKYLTLAMVLVALYGVCGVVIDFNPIDLRDPNSESVRAFRSLLQSKDTSPLTLTILADSEAQTAELQRQLEQLPSVDTTVSIRDFVPNDQARKIAILDDLALVLGPQLQDFPDLMPEHDAAQSLRDFQRTLDNAMDRPWKGMDRDAIAALRDEITRFLDAAASRPDPARDRLLQQLQISLLGALPTTIHNLQSSLEAQPIALADIPADFRERWLTPDEVYRIQIRPQSDLNSQANLREFIEEVQRVAPDATDLPVLYLESMKVVIESFQQAIGIALATIAALLLCTRRNIKETFLVMFPLMLSGLFTLAFAAFLHMPLNFVNIIALPLILGLGVDNGIHMVERIRHAQRVEQNIYASSTARGIFFGAVTQIAGFIGLVFSPHQGISSLGLIIIAGVAFTMWSTFVVLPSFARLAYRRETRHAEI